MSIEELDREDMRPQRLPWLVRLLRRVVFRLVRPSLVSIEERLAALETRCQALEVRTREASALAWDREATVRRLAALEDALAAHRDAPPKNS